jgi:signal transduction histidine kinase
VFINEKLGVIGGLTRHDIRNKLTTINGNVFLLKKTVAQCPEVMTRITAIEQAYASITEILDFAKMYEDLGAEELAFIDVHKTLDEAVLLFSVPSTVKIFNECGGLMVLADSFFRQLFYNLIDNSMKHGKHVTTIKVHYENNSDASIHLVYEDNGVGVSLADKMNLFKEGFNTGGSTGYGLYLIKKAMAVYGWAIQENGEPGKGAKFTITIPKINQSGKQNASITAAN